MTGPRISVVVPVCNGERFLERSIRSVLSQTYNDFELLALDDGSTDKSLEILCSFDDPRIKIIRNDKNLGISRTRNRGLFEAKGFYIAPIDQDDMWDARRLERQFEIMDSDPRYVIVGSWIHLIDSKDTVFHPLKPPSKPDHIGKTIIYRNPFCHSAVLFKREYALAVGGYDSRYPYAEEYCLWLRLLQCGIGLNVEEFLTYYRIHPLQLSAKKLRLQHRSAKLCRLAMAKHYRIEETKLCYNLILPNMWANLIGARNTLGNEYFDWYYILTKAGEKKAANKMLCRSLMCSILSRKALKALRELICNYIRYYARR
ncbi:Glycosyltransferase, GT2 family [Desulfacinum infernum DSM 9756]|uniref:Glycosyltransferase, GT2 family n=1 Tax=Desulfacinum infernum DSM 9756 TaxID=1121391 RepID=A0A1M5HX60_9BACT|nr:glycosyltransferase [Desulfacinum infernum]SHG20450.1 Glycosyltransferase, GT2 family [Desulfacinum infernum DSM 9756]